MEHAINFYNGIMTLPRHPTKQYATREAKDINGVVIHCTDVFHSHNATIQETTEHITNLGNNAIAVSPNNHLSTTGAPALPYHDVISPKGDIYHLNPYELLTWHATGHNSHNIGIALLHKTIIQDLNYKMYNTLILMCAIYCLKYNIQPLNIYGHRELQGTGWIDRNGRKTQIKTCPGYEVDLDKVRKDIILVLQTKLEITVDGLWGPQSEEALYKFYNQYALSGYVPEFSLFIHMKGRIFDYQKFINRKL